MSEVKRSEIIYEEGWREAAPAAEEQTPLDEEKPSDDPAPESPRDSKPLLITIRLAMCLLAALVLFLLKAMGSPSYHRFIEYYREELQKPVVSREVFGTADLSRLFADPAVTVKATPDETALQGD